MAEQRISDRIKVHTVSEITGLIHAQLEKAFGIVWVGGEVSNMSVARSGHCYFTLKDARAQISAVMWRTRFERISFEMKDGVEVNGRGRIAVYAAQGRYQLICEELTPKGLGAQDLALKRLKEKLLKLGYFERERKKPLPRFPLHIALVTSPTGAAVRDMLEILGRRWPIAKIMVCPVRVQGTSAAAELTNAIRKVNEFADSDVIILGRGGGPTEDLSPFNDENLAVAIYESQIPIVAAVGHEIDVSIADLVADRRAATPSEAAELVAPDSNDLLQDLRTEEGRMKTLLLRLLENRRQRLDAVSNRPVLRRPLDKIRDAETRLDQWESRLERAAKNRWEHARQKLASASGQLHSLSPLNVLGRGYSLTRKEKDGKVVRSVHHIQTGDKIVTFVADGQITSRVQRSHDTQNDLFADQAGAEP